MLSVCIPVFNQDIRELVRNLQKQMQELDRPGEIFLLDDCSDAFYQTRNREMLGWDYVRYEELKENAGRAKIRNLLAQRAAFQWLVMLDGNVAIPARDFLMRYIRELQDGHGVVCGGQAYPAQKPKRRFLLRYKYGSRVEAQKAAIRRLSPNVSFRTKNFAIYRELLLVHPLDERLKGYGHEDTLLGWQLYQAGITIHHSDNPVMHRNLDTNRAFMNKTRAAIKQLVYLQQLRDLPEEFFDEIRLIVFYKRLRNYYMHYPVLWVYRLTAPVLDALLCWGAGSLNLLAFYKLGYYMALIHR